MERIPVQPFHQDLKSGSVPLKDFDQCTFAIAECEHTAGVRIEMEFQFDDRCQTGIALSEVGNSTGQIDGCAPGKVKHGFSTPGAGQPTVWPDGQSAPTSIRIFSGRRIVTG